MTDPITPLPIDDELAWAALKGRDARFDGRFVTGVLSTGIYCRPSCAARHPKRENVRFFADGAAARAAGLRPCKRCAPDHLARDETAVRQAIAMLKAAKAPVAMAKLTTATGYSAAHLRKIFARATGHSPASYGRLLRDAQMREALLDSKTVTEAIYDSGYAAPSRFYERKAQFMAMTPSIWKNGGEGAVIYWQKLSSPFGPVMVGLTDKGLCWLNFGDDLEPMQMRFAAAKLKPASKDQAELLQQLSDAIAAPERAHSLPLDVQGTLFQQAVWQALIDIPPGETKSYAEIAAAIGKEKASRAVGSACGANPVSIFIPCHRALRKDGALGGYAWGLEVKRQLLAHEAEHSAAKQTHKII